MDINRLSYTMASGLCKVEFILSWNQPLFRLRYNFQKVLREAFLVCAVSFKEMLLLDQPEFVKNAAFVLCDAVSRHILRLFLRVKPFTAVKLQK